MLAFPSSTSGDIVYCATLRIGLRYMLMQHGQVIAYTSCQLKKHEQNYLAHDLEMVVMVFPLKIWRNYLFSEICEIYTNHKSLKYIFEHKDLNLRQRIWMELVKDYDCSILYHSGKVNIVINALSCKLMGNLASLEMREQKLKWLYPKFKTLGV